MPALHSGRDPPTCWVEAPEPAAISLRLQNRCFSMPDFAVYELIQLDTGVSLYPTTATKKEILEANNNLKAKGLSSRYFPIGTYHMPQLHSPPED